MGSEMCIRDRKESKQIHSQARLKDTVAYTGRRALLQKLAKRYNYVKQFPFQKAVKLPVSGTVVNITLHDTKAVIQRLLTDPRIKPEDYLFWEPGNPLAPPPETLDYVEDVTTGQAYRDTYDDMITEGGQALLGVILYCDGTPVSHFHNMELIQVKIALTIHTRKARLKPHMWGVLGYIEKVHEQGGRGRNILEQANHLDTQDANPNPNRYFVVKPKESWAQLFIDWLEEPHKLDEMEDLNEVEEDPDVMDRLEVDRPRKSV